MKEEIITFIMASLPIVELRGAIPLAIGKYGFSLPKAYALVVFGNMFLVIPFLFFLQKFSEYLTHKWYFYNRLMSWVFDRTRRKHFDHFHEKKWVEMALFIFVAIPLPMTGAWTGAVVAYLLGIPFWRASGAIFGGVLVAGVIMLVLMSLGIMAFKNFS